MFDWLRAIWMAFRWDSALNDEPVMYSIPHNPPHPANVPGPFYVEDGCCMACGVWEQEAPDLLAWLPNDEPQCYVKKQPETDEEFERMQDAMHVGEVDCIRVHACKPEWMDRLRKSGLGHHIDPPEGPKKGWGR